MVCAGVLLCGTPSLAAAREHSEDADVSILASDKHHPGPQAPTCGPCCHGSPSCPDNINVHKLEGVTSTGSDTSAIAADTDGTPDTNDPTGTVETRDHDPSEQGPPAIATGSGCTIVPDGPSGLTWMGLAALALMRRRNRHSSR